MYTDILEVTSFLRPFPNALEVFNEPVAQYAKHLHPLISIDLSIINSSWSGWIHIVSPIEPYNGCVGEYTTPFHNDYLRENWIAFRLENGRYSLLGDIRYFLLENPFDSHIEKYWSKYQEVLQNYYAKEEASYQKRRTVFLEQGGLFFDRKQEEGRFSKEDRLTLLDQLGGQVWAGNWSTSSEFQILESDAHEAVLFTRDGRPFHFIACVPGWHYRESGADSILLFYDPKEQIAMFTFDWT